MIAGLPVAAWLLIGAAIVPALALVTAFYAAHRTPRGSSSSRDGRRLKR